MDVIQHKPFMPLVFVTSVTFTLPKIHTFFFVIYEYVLLAACWRYKCRVCLGVHLRDAKNLCSGWNRGDLFLFIVNRPDNSVNVCM